MNTRTLALLNTLSFAGTVAVNAMANALPINGRNTGELSALYPNQFVPSGMTFSIWLVIYLGLTGFIIYQWGMLRDEGRTPLLRTLGLSFILTNVLNMSWILAWHYMQVFFSVIIMLALLYTLVDIHLKFSIPDRATSPGNKLWFQLPFSIYLGWILIATIANITALLVHLGWKGSPLSEDAWAVIMIAIATILCLWFLLKRTNAAIPIVGIWSIAGIMTRQRTVNGLNSIVIAGGIACAILLLGLLIRSGKKIPYQAGSGS